MPFYPLRCLYLFLFALASSLALSGQDLPPSRQLRVEHFSAGDGLVDDGVWSMVQDELGFIWLGTQLGLLRYDGVDMKPIPNPDWLGDISAYKINCRAMTLGPAGGLWIADAKGGIYRYDRYRESYALYLPDTTRQRPGLIGIPSRIAFGPDRSLWVATRANGLYRLQFSGWTESAPPRLDTLAHYHPDRGNFPATECRDLLVDAAGSVWIGTSAGLARWIPESESFELHVPHPGRDTSVPFRVFSIVAAPDGSLWMTSPSHHSLYRFDPGTRRFSAVAANPYGSSAEAVPLYHLFRDSRQQFWVEYRERNGAWKLLRYDPVARTVARLELQPSGPLSGAWGLNVRCFLEDRSGNVWVGSHGYGLIKYSPAQSVFRRLSVNEDPLAWRTDLIDQVLVGPGAQLYLHRQRKGWWKQPSEPAARDFAGRRPRQTPQPPLERYYDFEKNERGDIWYWAPGELYQYRAATGETLPLHRIYPALRPVVEQLIHGIAGTPDEGRYWLALGDTIYEFDTHTGRLESVLGTAELPDRFATRIFTRLHLDRYGKLWIGTDNGGFFRYDPTQCTTRYFDYSPATTFVEDPAGYLYAATYGEGVVQIDLQTLAARMITPSQADQSPVNKVRGGMVLDDRQRLWFGTHRGLYCFDPPTGQLRTYRRQDGLPTNEFTAYQADRTAGGHLVFGTLYGGLYFHPDSIRIDSTPPRVVFTDLALAGTTVRPDQASLLAQSLTFTEALRLPSYLNDLTIGFTALHFKNPAKNQYAVKLEPYETEWRYIGTRREAGYTNLDPGDYTFRVKAANSDGIWNEGIALAIQILPPWYWNGWSQTTYLLVLIGLLYAGYRFQLRRQLALAEAERLRAMDETKNRIYTNITHEFRTPLTVIDGTMERIEGYEQEKEIVHRNSHQLLLLVNRMLGLAKLEAGETRLSLIHGDVLHFLRYVTESFHSLAINQRINLNFHTELDQLEMDYDPEKILQLLSNLISNAIKFTPEYGKVTILARRHSQGGEPALELEVKDTGIGIAEADLPTIFERFHQLDAGATRRAEGTGIGLALVKELVELMEGDIAVASQPGTGTTFTVRLPIRHTARDADPLAQPVATSPLALASATTETHTAGPPALADGEVAQLLIVEDNHDVQQYLASCLRDEYDLLFARNGREGIDSAREHIPDLIISDVMMPEVDGFELCRTLKQDERTDHIPIVLLTAKADQAAKLEGLEYGADAYLVKPFHRRELEIRLQRLLELRRRLQVKYRQSDFATEPATAREDAFVRRVRRAVLDRIDDDSFDIEALCQVLNLHRSQVHRKLKALTGESTSHFIRRIRLQEAHRRLQVGSGSVKEIAYAVGFSNPAYFSRLFSREFGTPPSQVGPDSTQ